jgi:hypothetical protein
LRFASLSRCVVRFPNGDAGTLHIPIMSRSSAGVLNVASRFITFRLPLMRATNARARMTDS